MGLFRPEPKIEPLRIYIASDLHGSTVCFKKVLNASEVYGADAVLIAGDLTGKMVVPIVEKDGRFVSLLHGQQHVLDASEIADHEAVIDSAGLYPYRTTEEELELLRSDQHQLDAIFHSLVLERVEQWMELGESRLRGTGTTCFLIAGNDDYPEIDALLRQGESLRFIDGSVSRIDDHHEVAGLGVSNKTPWDAPRDISEGEIADRLEALLGDLEDPERSVLMVHVPPRDTMLDLAPELDGELRPTGGGDNMINVGSSSVRAAIERHQPLLTVHGHLHESRGLDKIGRSICVNPGSEYSQGILRGALVNVSPSRVEGHLFVSG